MGTMRKKEGHLFIVSESANWYSHLRDSVGKYPKNIKINLPQDSAIYTTVYTKGLYTYFREICLFIFLVALFIIARNQNKHRHPSTNE